MKNTLCLLTLSFIVGLANPTSACSVGPFLSVVWPPNASIDIPTHTQVWIHGSIPHDINITDPNGYVVEIESYRYHHDALATGGGTTVYQLASTLENSTTYTISTIPDNNHNEAFDTTFTTHNQNNTNEASIELNDVRYYRREFIEGTYYDSCYPIIGTGEVHSGVVLKAIEVDTPILYTYIVDIPTRTNHQFTASNIQYPEDAGEHQFLGVISSWTETTPCIEITAQDPLGSQATQTRCMLDGCASTPAFPPIWLPFEQYQPDGCIEQATTEYYTDILVDNVPNKSPSAMGTQMDTSEFKTKPESDCSIPTLGTKNKQPTPIFLIAIILSCTVTRRFVFTKRG